MFFVYFLQSQRDGNLYIGRTNDLNRRLAEHNRGAVQATKARGPLVLLGYDECLSKEESVRMEKEWKKGYRREQLKIRFNIKKWRGGRVV